MTDTAMLRFPSLAVIVQLGSALHGTVLFIRSPVGLYREHDPNHPKNNDRFPQL